MHLQNRTLSFFFQVKKKKKMNSNHTTHRLVSLADLPRWKHEGNLIIMCNLPRKCDEDGDKDDLIVMSDLSK